MPISFPNFPSDWKLPLHWIDVDASRAGTPQASTACLVVGVKTGGNAPANTPVAVSSLDALDSLFGAGSQAARMARVFLRNFPSAKLFAAGVSEPSAGVAATKTITVATPPTAAGTLSLYIAGQRIQVAVAATDTATQIATKIAAAVTALTSLPVTATSNTGVVTLTCKWKGATGNDIVLADNLLGIDGGEVMPAGVTVTYANGTAGTSAPDYSAIIAKLSDDDYKFVAIPDTDTTTLGLWATEYGFTASGRWGFLRALYGGVFSAVRNVYADHMTAGPTRNDPTLLRMAIEPACPTPVWEIAAAYAAQAAAALINDPARPLQTLEFLDVMVAPRGTRFSKTQLNNMAGVGLSTQTISPNGRMMIVRETTSYQQNLNGAADNAFADFTTLATLWTLFERQHQVITSKYPRHKLADDGTRFGPGQAIITPRAIKGELVAQYAADEFLGLTENARAFAKNLIVERDADNPTRVNVLYPPDLVNGLRIFAVLAQFRLQYSAQDIAA